MEYSIFDYTLDYEIITDENGNDSITIYDCSECNEYGNYIEYVNIPSEIDDIPVTEIDDNTFYGHAHLRSITIPDSVKTIGCDAFSECTNLTNISIGNGVTRICNYAFYSCENLTNITIPDGVSEIESDIFPLCQKLTDIKVSENNEKYCDVDGILFSKDKTTLVSYPAGKSATSYDIPNSVTSIGKFAFEDCSALISIAIPSSVTSIGDHAFDGCNALESVIIPGSVTDIGEYAFNGCDELTNVTIGNGVKNIHFGAFYACESLTSITIPNSVTKIEHDAFSGCNLEEIHAPAHLIEWLKEELEEEYPDINIIPNEPEISVDNEPVVTSIHGQVEAIKANATAPDISDNHNTHDDRSDNEDRS